MIKIIDNQATKPRTITTNEIPARQVFRGRIYAEVSKFWSTGLFLKPGMSNSGNPLVVSLEHDSRSGKGNGLLWWNTCVSVEDYEPVDVEIRVM